MSNAVHKQQSALGSHFAAPTLEDDIGEDLHARIIGLELELKRLGMEIESMRGAMAARDERTSVVLDAYKSIIGYLTSVIESQRDEIAALEARIGRETVIVPALDGSPKRASWPRKLFG